MVLSLTHSGRSQRPTSGNSPDRVGRTRSRGPDSVATGSLVQAPVGVARATKGARDS